MKYVEHQKNSLKFLRQKNKGNRIRTGNMTIEEYSIVIFFGLIFIDEDML